MSRKYSFKPASQQELSLYCFVGEAVCAVQHVEDALSHSIVLKKAKPRLKSEADKLLEKHRSFTLGKAIKIAERASLYPESLQKELKEFLSERNWLIHKSIAQGRDEWDLNISREKMISRIKAISIQSQKLLQLIEEDLIGFSEANGVDMSRVKAEINRHYFE
ncbi:hypothetical protein G9409_06310 [Chlorobium sp. BLA1]|uniref:hypothetical protein n=1 Tax=Candidatus Chlorobium masyuteum TaxID=2716876 RepID=UPI001422FD03|nr:hypothetical protein [Candidatus Chlorobium masyuteum]NHQ60207.1 hypothetical protein [Candidatus Chlorobium masyuteum]